MFRQPKQVVVSLLAYGEAPRVRLAWDSRFTPAALRSHLELHPRLSFWNRTTGEYAIGGRWRGRRDVGAVLETSKGNSQSLLVETLVTRFREDGFRAVVLSQDEADAACSLYLASGWRKLDCLLVYRLTDAWPYDRQKPTDLAVSSFHPGDLAGLTSLDREVFPWLWWNDPSDFLAYSSSENVAVFLARAGDGLLGYVSYSSRNNRGHLDRLAVRPASGGKGYGSWLLDFAVRRMWQSGIRDIGLTTQETNLAAQGLYQRFGFVKTGETHEVIGQELAKT